MDVNEIQGKIDALKILLTQTDYKSLKLAEALAYGEDISEYQEIMQKRQAWRDRINELEEELDDAAENITNENT